MSTRILKPGYLVWLKTTISGGVAYTRTDIGLEQDGKSERKEWSTTKHTTDVEEADEATKVRSKCQALVKRQCIDSDNFGLLCPHNRADQLDADIEEAQDLAGEFNTRARYTRISLYTMKGRISETDEEATKSLCEEIKGFLDQMDQGVKDLSVDAIRDAADKARAVGRMLDEDQEGKVTEAVKAARAAARQIVRRVDKAGEDGAAVLADLNTKPIETARFAFLDLLESVEIEGKEAPAVSTQRFADIGDENGVEPFEAPTSGTTPAGYTNGKRDIFVIEPGAGVPEEEF